MIPEIATYRPLKSADPDRLAAVLAEAERLGRSRDPGRDKAAYGPVDPVDWSIEAVRALTASHDPRESCASDRQLTGSTPSAPTLASTPVWTSNQ